MTIIPLAPSYHRVTKVIVKPRWSQPHPNIEDVLNVVLIDEEGKELVIACLHGPGSSPIEMEVQPYPQHFLDAMHEAHTMQNGADTLLAPATTEKEIA